MALTSQAVPDPELVPATTQLSTTTSTMLPSAPQQATRTVCSPSFSKERPTTNVPMTMARLGVPQGQMDMAKLKGKALWT